MLMALTHDFMYVTQTAEPYHCPVIGKYPSELRGIFWFILLEMVTQCTTAHIAAAYSVWRTG